METSFVLIVLFFAALATGGLIVNWIGLGRAMSRLSVSSYIEFHQHTNHTFDPYSQAPKLPLVPAQSLSYKIGQLKIRELRSRAQQELGPRFDIRKLHDEILSAGSLSMDMLGGRINGWIKSEQASGEKSGQPQIGS